MELVHTVEEKHNFYESGRGVERSGMTGAHWYGTVNRTAASAGIATD